MRTLILPALIAFPTLVAQPLEIRFTTPAGSEPGGSSKNFMSDAVAFPHSSWESHAQPLGNGRIGAMVKNSWAASRSTSARRR